jgi:hypothetical protein
MDAEMSLNPDKMELLFLTKGNDEGGFTEPDLRDMVTVLLYR